MKSIPLAHSFQGPRTRLYSTSNVIEWRPGNGGPGKEGPGNEEPGNKGPGNEGPGNEEPGNKGSGNKASISNTTE